jgi:hypothetical protein
MMINELASLVERLATWTNFGLTTFSFALPFTLWAVWKLLRDLLALRSSAVRAKEMTR